LELKASFDVGAFSLKNIHQPLELRRRGRQDAQLGQCASNTLPLLSTQSRVIILARRMEGRGASINLGIVPKVFSPKPLHGLAGSIG
jgi:hypothetical protein